jgi:PBP1b-binding outer membrane lipoprotein LpoB
MRKIFVLFLILALGFILVGCSAFKPTSLQKEHMKARTQALKSYMDKTEKAFVTISTDKNGRIEKVKINHVPLTNDFFNELDID